jgi:hypothetical protein
MDSGWDYNSKKVALSRKIFYICYLYFFHYYILYSPYFWRLRVGIKK